MNLFRTQRTSIGAKLVAIVLSVLLLGTLTPWCCLLKSGHHHGARMAAEPDSPLHGAMGHATLAESDVAPAATHTPCAFAAGPPQAKAGDASLSLTLLRWTLRPISIRLTVVKPPSFDPMPIATTRPPPSPIPALEPPPPRAS